MEAVDPLAVDREVRKCAERWRTFRRTLQAGETPILDPFAASRWALGRTTLNQLAELKSDPIAPSLLRWVYRLTEQRVNRDLLVEISGRLRRDEHAVEGPEAGRYTVSSMLHRGLVEGPQQRAWLKQTLAHAGATHEAVVHLWERRQELSGRLGFTSPDEVSAPSENLSERAERWITDTEELWQARPSLELSDLLGQAMGSASSLDWPARLSPRSLLGLFADTRLFEGLQLDPGRLPEGLSPTSYMRALARLGAAFVDATAPRDQPFCIAHDAFGLERRRHGALLALLFMNGEFLRRRLGGSKNGVLAARRSLATSLLVATRLAAFRVLLRQAALRGGKRLEETFDSELPRVCRVELPRPAAGVFIRLHEDDPQRFAGTLLGAHSTLLLTDNHDEDWFRNPRAIDQLRSEAQRPPEHHAGEVELDSGARVLQDVIREALQ